MSLESISQKGENLLSIPAIKRNGVWASSLNNLRGDILFRIIEIFPTAEEVRAKILPLFYREIGALESIPQNQQDPLAYHLPGFLRNFQTNVKDLENYMSHFLRCGGSTIY